MSEGRFRLMVTGKVTGAPELDGWTPDGADEEIPLCRFRVKVAKAAGAPNEEADRMPQEGDSVSCTAWGEPNAEYAHSLRKGDYVGVIGIAQWREGERADYCNVTAKGTILLKRDKGAAHDAKTKEQKQREREQEMAAKRAERQAAKEAAEEAARREAEATPPKEDDFEDDIPF